MEEDERERSAEDMGRKKARLGLTPSSRLEETKAELAATEYRLARDTKRAITATEAVKEAEARYLRLLDGGHDRPSTGICYQLGELESAAAQLSTMLEEQADVETDCRVLLERALTLRAQLEHQTVEWSMEYLHGHAAPARILPEGGLHVIEISDDDVSSIEGLTMTDDGAEAVDDEPGAEAKLNSSPSADNEESNQNHNEELQGGSSDTATTVLMSGITITHPKSNKGGGGGSA